MVPIGEVDYDRNEYLTIATEASILEQVDEDEQQKEPWSKLATFIIKKAAANTAKLKEMVN